MARSTSTAKRFEEVSLLKEEEDLFSQTENMAFEPTLHRRRHYCIPRTIASALISIFIAAIIVLTVIAVATQQIPNIPKSVDRWSDSHVVQTTLDCGTSPQEAKAKGCIFDLMNYHWIRPECYNEEASKEAAKRGPWKWYYDLNATRPIPGGQNAERLSQEVLVYTEHDWHVTHCVYALKTVHRAAMNPGEWLPEEEGSWNHTEHCAEVLQMTGTPGEIINTVIDMQYLPCVRFGTK